MTTQSKHEHTEFQGAYTARKGFKKCATCLETYAVSSQSKQEELRKNIEQIILSWSSEISGEQREKLHPETDQLVLRHIDLINSGILTVLEELESECDTHNEDTGCSDEVSYVPLSAIQTIKEKYL